MSCVPRSLTHISRDTIEFLGPDSSAMFGAGTSATEPRTPIVDGAEVCLEQGEQVVDVHLRPLGEELQELIQYIFGSVSSVPVGSITLGASTSFHL